MCIRVPRRKKEHARRRKFGEKEDMAAFRHVEFKVVRSCPHGRVSEELEKA